MSPSRVRIVDLGNLDDELLVASSRTGDQAASVELFRRYEPIARSIAYKYRPNLGDEWRSLFGICLYRCISSPSYSPLLGSFARYFKKAFTYALNDEARDTSRRRSFEHSMSPHGWDLLVAELSGSGADDDASTELGNLIRIVADGFRSHRTRRRQREVWARVAELMFLEGRGVLGTAEDLGECVATIEQIVSRRIYPAVRALCGPVLQVHIEQRPNYSAAPQQSGREENE
jgi:hypothetical protein